MQWRANDGQLPGSNQRSILRRWSQFGLRTLLLSMMLCSVFAACSAQGIRELLWPEYSRSPLPGDGESYPPHYVKALEALAANQIRPGMSLRELGRISPPDQVDRVGQYLLCHYTGLPGYVGLEIVARDQQLVRAVDSGCTYQKVFFDEMSPRESQRYRKLILAWYQRSNQ